MTFFVLSFFRQDFFYFKNGGILMKLKTVLYDEVAINRALSRISHEIIEKNNGTMDIVLVAIKNGGVPIAKVIKQKIESWEKGNIPIIELDITPFRDDVRALISRDYEFDVMIEGKKVIICDDVIFTGRSVRAAIDAIIKQGRPKSIQLAVLVDRGHRELPIRADYVGKNVPTSQHEKIVVNYNDLHELIDISLYE
jgi:pyrimidine operon attenuation protein/uracil phosphoribosyltransferase